MAVRCPLVSLFSGQPQDPGVSRDRTRVNAEVVCKHALMHCMLIRDYVSREGDITRLSSLVGFASFVATSILLALARSEARRRGNEDGLIQASNQFLQLMQDTMNLLDVLKIYWQPLVLMATKLQKSVDGTLKVRNVPFGISCMDEVRAIQVPVTGVNSPTENQEDIIATVYVENLAPGRDVAESILRADAVQQRGAEPAPCVQEEGDLFLGGSNELDLHHIIPGISEDFFCTSLDYSDLDLGPIYPTQMA
ncbi:hypothetical protein NW755_006355 [Fusarium falciforme]|uniref:Uncharacterized protein n=1 Tax=Fusarium falciforme TaxID=195108 RepID=A0A9W8R991_9HYPO|nr:hypothetical protein NW755_006355 [Fusarium falciforme]